MPTMQRFILDRMVNERHIAVYQADIRKERLGASYFVAFEQGWIRHFAVGRESMNTPFVNGSVLPLRLCLGIYSTVLTPCC